MDKLSESIIEQSEQKVYIADFEKHIIGVKLIQTAHEIISTISCAVFCLTRGLCRKQ